MHTEKLGDALARLDERARWWAQLPIKDKVTTYARCSNSRCRTASAGSRRAEFAADPNAERLPALFASALRG